MEAVLEENADVYAWLIDRLDVAMDEMSIEYEIDPRNTDMGKIAPMERERANLISRWQEATGKLWPDRTL